MIVRIARFKELPERPLAPEHDGFRTWLSQQPGFVRAEHCRNPETGEAVSISYWESREHLSELKTQTPPAGPPGLKPESVDVYEIEHEF